jgi:hypothetical protein
VSLAHRTYLDTQVNGSQMRGLGGSGLWVAPTPRLVSGWASLELWRQLDPEALFQKLHVSEVLVNRRVAVGMT